MNQTTINPSASSTMDNDLQKAIDDITNNANINPVFSDPVAAPSSIPEGDTGELGEPVGPFPISTSPAPSPTPQLESFDFIDMPTPAAQTAPSPLPDQLANTPLPPANALSNPPLETPTSAPLEQSSEPLLEQPIESYSPEPYTPEPQHQAGPLPENSNFNQIREAALRDLAPIMDKAQLEPAQKFQICKDIFENLKDSSVLNSAYRAASEITDESERAEALLYLINAIDKM